MRKKYSFVKSQKIPMHGISLDVYKQFSLRQVVALSIRNVKSNLNPDHSDAHYLNGVALSHGRRYNSKFR